jgi:hypothetical protein
VGRGGMTLAGQNEYSGKSEQGYSLFILSSFLMLLSSNLSLSHFPSPLSLSLFLQGIDIYRIAQEDAAFALNLVSYDMQQLVTVYIR